MSAIKIFYPLGTFHYLLAERQHSPCSVWSGTQLIKFRWLLAESKDGSSYPLYCCSHLVAWGNSKKVFFFIKKQAEKNYMLSSEHLLEKAANRSKRKVRRVTCLCPKCSEWCRHTSHAKQQKTNKNILNNHIFPQISCNISMTKG